MINCIQKLILSTALCIGFTASHAKPLNTVYSYEYAKDGDESSQYGYIGEELNWSKGQYITIGYGYSKDVSDHGFGLSTKENGGVFIKIEGAF